MNVFILTKNGQRYLHITENNLDALYIAPSKNKNICCSLRNEVRSLGIYSSSFNGNTMLSMIFDVVSENINSNLVYKMPSTDEEMSKMITEWEQQEGTKN